MARAQQVYQQVKELATQLVRYLRSVRVVESFASPPYKPEVKIDEYFNEHRTIGNV
jgi:hypothetical protein